MPTISEALATAQQLHRSGRLREAEPIYRQILQVDPGHAVATHLLGLVAVTCGSVEPGIALYRRSIALNPGSAAVHGDLGAALKGQGKVDEAIAAYRQALALDPHGVQALHNLSEVLCEQGDLDEAERLAVRAVTLRPDISEIQNNLGNVYQRQHLFEQAMECYRQAIVLKPGNAQAHSNLGMCCNQLGNLTQAVACFREAILLAPDFAEAYSNLGQTLTEQGQLDSALALLQRAHQLAPESADIGIKIGNVFKDLGNTDAAVASYRKALEVDPKCAPALSNLANLMNAPGLLDESIAMHRRAQELAPQSPGIHSSILFSLLLRNEETVETLFDEHQRWNQQHAVPFAQVAGRHRNAADPHRRLKVGYVSPDLNRHPVGLFMEPLLESHDHEAFEIFCYSSVRKPDPITENCKRNSDHWVQSAALSDAQLAEKIREDEIDILVDLSMHTTGNRLLVFARKPAPVQVTYLAYCGTTGLSAIDYRLSDPYIDRPCDPRQFYSEETVLLPDTFWCYKPFPGTPPVAAVPALMTGQIRFGCLNAFRKVSPKAFLLWCELLRRLPDSSLVLHAHPGSQREGAKAIVESQGISGDRLIFVGHKPIHDYFATYNSIDVALDPFPYGGGTTTCDALWMGVPVVSLAGHTPVGRGGLSILSNIGLPELVAHDPQEYVEIATGLASDLTRLSELRQTLRARMRLSALMDSNRFARNVEAAYRGMWERWCKGI